MFLYPCFCVLYFFAIKIIQEKNYITYGEWSTYGYICVYVCPNGKWCSSSAFLSQFLSLRLLDGVLWRMNTHDWHHIQFNIKKIHSTNIIYMEWNGMWLRLQTNIIKEKTYRHTFMYTFPHESFCATWYQIHEISNISKISNTTWTL